MRKLVTLLLVVAMVLGMVGSAFAATFPDVTNTAQTGPVEKLNILGILTGDNGQFRPNDSITRAEFSAVVVRALGLESAAKLINTQPNFKDVTAAQSWAWGYISIASSKGIVKGYPDGTFRPSASVSYAEAVTMLLRAGNWDAECSKLTWPAGFIMKATEYDLTVDTNFDAMKPATRGDVAVMTYADLSAPIAVYNDTTKAYEESSDTILSKNLKATNDFAVVTKVPQMDSALQSTQAVLDTIGKVTMPAGTNINTLLGHKIEYIKFNSSSTLKYVADSTTASNIVVGDANGDATNNAGLTITVNDVDKHYDFAVATDNATQGTLKTAYYVVRNNVFDTTISASTTDATIKPVKDGDKVTAFLNAEGKVRYVIATAATVDGVVAAKTVNGVGTATADTFTVGGTKYTVKANTAITKNGTVAAFADLAVGDVAYVIADLGNNAMIVDLYNKPVTGTVSSVGFASNGKGKVVVGGTTYTVSGDWTKDVTLNGTALTSTANLGQLIGANVTMYLDADGYARIVKATKATIIGKVADKTTSGLDTLVTLNVRGTNTVYTLPTTAVAATLIVGDYAQVSTYSDGRASAITEVSLALGATPLKVKAIDTTAKVITLESATGVLSLVSYNTNAYGIRSGSWGDVSAIAVGDMLNYITAGGAIAYYEDGVTAVTAVAGKYVGTTAVDGKTHVFVNVAGTVKDYIAATGYTDGHTKSFVLAALSASTGEVSSLADLDTTAGTGNIAAVEGTVTTISGNIILVGGTVYDLSNAGLYKYSTTSSKFAASDISYIAETTQVAVFTNTTTNKVEFVLFGYTAAPNFIVDGATKLVVAP